MFLTRIITVLVLVSILFSCKKKNHTNTPDNFKIVKIHQSKGFSIKQYEHFKVIDVHTPWPEAKDTITYLLVDQKKEIPPLAHDVLVRTPIHKAIATSTTHIPFLEILEEAHTLVGFPSTNYISSTQTRQRIDQGKIIELGSNEHINTELALSLQPDVLFGFGIDGSNKAYNTLQKAGTPIVYIGDWVEKTPLARTEWIHFFGAFYDKEAIAERYFDSINNEYTNAKKLAQHSQQKPTILSGAMYKDIWYLPGGQSWMAQFYNDANAEYLWKDTNNTGSLSLNFETVFDQAQQADLWINPSHFESYEALQSENPHYNKFKAFKQKKCYTNAIPKGATGGLLFYEKATSQPDVVLKDLIKIIHPEILPTYTPYFFAPLQD